MNDCKTEHSEAFKKLQEEANRVVKRYHPNYDKEFILETDASNMGVGALLYQVGNNGQKQIIKPIAAKFNKSEVNWGITEKEMYAIIWAVKKFEMYLLGRRFKIITDHKAAQWIKDKADLGNARIQRWLELLQYSDFTISYRSGDEMYEADALSWMHKIDTVENVLTEEQRRLIEQVHQEASHRGVEVIEYAIRKNYTNWPNIKAHIKQVLGECEICIRNRCKNDGGSEFIETKRKNEKMGIDIAVMMPVVR